MGNVDVHFFTVKPKKKFSFKSGERIFYPLVKFVALLHFIELQIFKNIYYSLKNMSIR